MPDERLDSAQRADGERREEIVRSPGPEMGGAMGGSNAPGRAGDEADMDADLRRGLPDDRTRPDGGATDARH